MKKLFFIILFFRFINCSAQQPHYTFYQLYQLDSIAGSNSIGKHFGALYFYFLGLVEARLENADSSTRRLVRHFEQVFAQFYIDACIAYEQKEQVPLPAWRSYFQFDDLNAVQYNLLGTNAHLNGGLAEAIAGSYTPDEWKRLKSKYVLFNRCLNQTFQKVYSQTVRSGKAKILSIISFGLTNPLGKYYLYKWRKRQMRLTEYYFEHSPKYVALLNKINKKKEKIDRMILTQLETRSKLH